MSDKQANDFPKDGCAIVFGGSGGIGEAICALLARDGVDVVITYRSKAAGAEKAAARVRGHGRKAEIVSCQIEDRASVDEAFAFALEKFGRVHSVVSAGGAPFAIKPFADFTLDDLTEVVQADIYGVFNITQGAITTLRAGGGGTLTALTSCGVSRVLEQDAMSIVPKAAVAAMIRQVACEEARNGIRANGVAPGAIDAGITLVIKEENRALYDYAETANPLKRFASAEECAEVVVFLASAKGGFINGQIVNVDGGYTA